MRHILISAAKGLAQGKDPRRSAGTTTAIFGAERVLAPGEDWRTLAIPEDRTFAKVFGLG